MPTPIIIDAYECASSPTALCLNDDADDESGARRERQLRSRSIGGQVFGHDLDELGTLDHTSQNANSWGLSGQGVEKSTIMGMHNQFLLGASYDHGSVGYASSSDLGVLRTGVCADNL